MNIGTLKIEQLSEGFYELFEDGSFQKMDHSRLEKLKDDPNIGTYTSAIGIDPLLIQTPDTNVLVDPGLGWGMDHGSQFKDSSNIVTNLDIFNLSPDDIHFVILTHLHFDHAAGATYVSENFTTAPTFPNAKYIVHKEEWEYALSLVEKEVKRPGVGYKLDELYRLAADGKFIFVDGELYEPADGITAIKTGGHTPGHMAVKLQENGNTAYFLGDLVPTEYHLNHYSMGKMDVDPIQAKKAKTRLLKQALKERAVMFFYHSLFHKSGQLSRDPQKKYILLDPK